MPGKTAASMHFFLGRFSWGENFPDIKLKAFFCLWKEVTA